MKTFDQKGFTLIELMISILIGLIIIAAVTQIYVTGVRNAAVQKAAAGVLDANVFGLQQVEKNLRMAGLGLGETSKLNRACSGIIVTDTANFLNCDGTEVTEPTAGDKYAKKLGGLVSGKPLKEEWRTKADGGPVNTSNGKGSQLTIQYRAPVDMRDCEGRLALGPREAKGRTEEGRPLEDGARVDGQVIVERYFTKKNAEGELELRCDAGRYVLEHISEEVNSETGDRQAARQNAIKEAGIIGDDTPLQDMGDDGSLIISGLDDFQVQFGVASAGSIRYQNIAEYKNGDIVAVKIGILAKGNNKIPQIDASDASKYPLLGKEVTLASDQPTNLIRRTYETTTMLRNSREGKQ